ncbi:MAG: hypothetical protein ED556_03010 [Winogradskyella sp.]|uniref:O-antigen polymerase n=1 Tax=Winogradskyella sp. TaxID=1883156 RepID=UPI000F4062AB|nr:O-antigen polymerase [Winogradskyella sp.]RNC88169.1 MAG: hypothetical protein ED556_03010 [Winogradskyella sp.]
MYFFRTFERILIYVLVISIVVFPFSYYEIKLPIISWLIIKSIILIFQRGKIDLPILVFGFFLIYAFLGLFYIFYGIITGNAHPESFPYVFALYVVFPIVYFLILNGIPKKSKIIKYADKYFIHGAIGVSIVLLIAFLNKKYGLPEYLNFLVETINVDIRTTVDVVKINYNGISSILFLFPYFFTSLILINPKRTKKEKTWLIIGVLVTFFGVFLTGRRSVIILYFFSILMTFLFKLIIERKKIKFKKKILKYALIIFISLLPFTYYLNIGSIINSATSTISYALKLESKEKGKSFLENERVKQTTEFSKHIVMRPVLGYGHGAYMKTIIRSEEKPWRYEISYLDLIFHTGFLGFILYSIGPVWLLLSLIKIMAYNNVYRARALGLINALICVFIAYATNPYLNAFDIQWILFYPVLFIIIINRQG